MIKVYKNADSRTAETLTEEALCVATQQHVIDVFKGLKFFADLIDRAAGIHDRHKLYCIKNFHSALISGNIKESEWYKDHIRMERHHLNHPDGVPDDVNLIDVLEHLVDCVMAGLTRSGEITDIELSNEILQKAHRNTVKLLMKNVDVKS
jgi:hypothetical protein